MPVTTNFLIAGTNNLIDAYNVVTNSPATTNTPFGIPGMDPEIAFDSSYATNGVRRLKFGGSTCADDGIRLAMEQMMANSGFNDPDVIKYMVIFTDGHWNTARTMFAAPAIRIGLLFRQRGTQGISIPPLRQTPPRRARPMGSRELGIPI